MVGECTPYEKAIEVCMSGLGKLKGVIRRPWNFGVAKITMIGVSRIWKLSSKGRKKFGPYFGKVGKSN